MTRLSRRRLLAGALAARVFGGSFVTGAARPANASEAGADSLPWHNWSGGQSSQPAGRFAPETEDQLIEFLGRDSGPLRPVGSGHSFSGLVPTDGHIVVLDKLTGLRGQDPATLEATFGAGIRLAEIGPVLEEVGQGMFNLPDIDRQTLAGAISTATHGTGLSLNTLSAYVTRTSARHAVGQGDGARRSERAAPVRRRAGLARFARLRHRSAHAQPCFLSVEEDLPRSTNRGGAAGFRSTSTRALALRNVPADALEVRERGGHRRNRRADQQPASRRPISPIPTTS